MPISVVADNVRSLFNVGAMFRLCDAILAERLFLTGVTGYPNLGLADLRPPYVRERADREIRKTAIRTVDHVPWEYRPDAAEVVRELRSGGVQIVTLELTAQSVAYTEADYRYPLCVLVGHERAGVADELLELSDLRVEIPMLGMGSSLNVAVALGVLGYELIRQRAARG